MCGAGAGPWEPGVPSPPPPRDPPRLPPPRPPPGTCQRSRRGGFIDRQWCPPDAASLTAARSRSPRCRDGRCHHTCALVHTYWHLRVSLSLPGFLKGLEAGIPCSWATRALPLGLSSASIRLKRRAEIRFTRNSAVLFATEVRSGVPEHGTCSPCGMPPTDPRPGVGAPETPVPPPRCLGPRWTVLGR